MRGRLLDLQNQQQIFLKSQPIRVASGRCFSTLPKESTYFKSFGLEAMQKENERDSPESN